MESMEHERTKLFLSVKRRRKESFLSPPPSLYLKQNIKLCCCRYASLYTMNEVRITANDNVLIIHSHFKSLHMCAPIGNCVLTLNGNMEVAEFRVSWRICGSVDHGMTAFRKHVRWRHLWRNSNGRVGLVIVCSCDWSPGHCGRGLPFVGKNTSCSWTGFTKWRGLPVYEQKNEWWSWLDIFCLTGLTTGILSFWRVVQDGRTLLFWAGIKKISKLCTLLSCFYAKKSSKGGAFEESKVEKGRILHIVLIYSLPFLRDITIIVWRSRSLYNYLFQGSHNAKSRTWWNREYRTNSHGGRNIIY